MTTPQLIHPGEILREEYLEELGLSAYQLAKAIGVPQTRISAILNEKRRITADTALRLGKYFKTHPQFWLNLQNSYELRKAILDQGGSINHISGMERVVRKQGSGV